MMYFIGAGPGDPDLLTVRAARLLGVADYVIYPENMYLEEILVLVSSKAILMPIKNFSLEKQIDFIEFMAVNYPDVNIVRLHTGDLAFESGYRDLLDCLRMRSIVCECVPGISAVSAIASRLGLDYLLGGVSHSCTVSLSAAERFVPALQGLVSKAVGGGAVIVYGVNADTISLTVRELTAAGRQPECFVVLVSKVTQADEKIVVTTLEKAAAVLTKYRFGRFTMLLSGDFLEAVNPYCGVALLEFWKKDKGIIVDL